MRVACLPERLGGVPWALIAAAVLLSAAPAAAQAPSRPGPWALDVRGVTSPVPQDPSFYPPLDTKALVPERGFGMDIGAHVYLFNLGAARVGIGAHLVTVRATTNPQEPIPPVGQTTPVADLQNVSLTMQSIAPQLSLNFGSRNGWSYVSAGMGRMHVRVETSEVNPARRETGDVGNFWDFWDLRRFKELRKLQDLNVINVGGGARWFMKSHMGFTFDVRLYLVPEGTAGPVILEEALVDPAPSPTPTTPVVVVTPSRMQLIVGAGLTFR